MNEKFDLLQIKLILFFLVAFIVLTFVPSEAFADWYDSSWEHRKKITISLNTVISSDLDNFPVLVSTIDTDLIQTTESDGTDIVFTTSDGKTLLDYEIEKFDQSTGELVAWTANLATWTIEEKITPAEMIIAIEHVINNF